VSTKALVPAGLLIALMTPVAALAQGGTPPPTEPTTPDTTMARVQTEADAELKAQLNAFSALLRDAVETGGQRLAEWANGIVPGIQLALATNPIVEGTPLPDGSVLFDVRIPEILQTSVVLWLRQAPQAGATTVSRAGGRVSGTSVVKGDEMVVPPGSPARRTPNQQFSDFVREALIDTVIDGSRLVAIEQGQWLTVAASGIDVAITNPLYRNTSRKLILSLKGEDVQAYLRGDITRDEVEARIVERRF
jgi:hypothetical protein